MTFKFPVDIDKFEGPPKEALEIRVRLYEGEYFDSFLGRIPTFIEVDENGCAI